MKDSPYIKGIVHSDDSQAISESLDRIEEMIEERKMLFSSKGVPNYQSFKETYPNHFLETEILIINGYGDLY
ncbi:MAG: hypothetical protein K2H85_05170, partial [Allobaculum sp.]|nr:hypothetical protein [Allobaculum sp.]